MNIWQPEKNRATIWYQGRALCTRPTDKLHSLTATEQPVVGSSNTVQLADDDAWR